MWTMFGPEGTQVTQIFSHLEAVCQVAREINAEQRWHENHASRIQGMTWDDTGWRSSGWFKTLRPNRLHLISMWSSKKNAIWTSRISFFSEAEHRKRHLEHRVLKNDKPSNNISWKQKKGESLPIRQPILIGNPHFVPRHPRGLHCCPPVACRSSPNGSAHGGIASCSSAPSWNCFCHSDVLNSKDMEMSMSLWE